MALTGQAILLAKPARASVATMEERKTLQATASNALSVRNSSLYAWGG